MSKKKKQPAKRYVILYNYTGSHDTFVGTKDEVLEQLRVDISMGELKSPDDVHIHELGVEIPIQFEKTVSVTWPK